MKKYWVVLCFCFILSPTLVMGADYVLKKDSFVFSNQFQIAHLENLSGDDFSGYLNDQLNMGRAYFNRIDINVIIVDSCTFCQLGAVKLKTKDGKNIGWVFKHDLKRVKKK